MFLCQKVKNRLIMNNLKRRTQIWYIYRWPWPKLKRTDKPLPSRKPFGKIASHVNPDSTPKCVGDQPESDFGFTGRDRKSRMPHHARPEQQFDRKSAKIDRRLDPSPKSDSHQKQFEKCSVDNRKIEKSDKVMKWRTFNFQYQMKQKTNNLSDILSLLKTKEFFVVK